MEGYQTQLRVIGYIHKPHGLEGACQLVLTHSLGKKPYALFIKQHHTFVPYLVKALAREGQQISVEFEEVNDRTTATQFSHCEVALDPADFKRCVVTTLQPTRDLTGYKVITQKGEYIGEVTGMQTHRQPNLEVKGAYGVIPIPFVREKVIIKIETTTKTITVVLADGFLDMFAEKG